MDESPQSPDLGPDLGLIWRVAVYIDGFNLFYGLRSKGWRRYYWLDIYRLAQNLLIPGQSLAAVKYFTARVHDDPRDPGKRTRQNAYLDALATIPELSVHYGYFLPITRRCPNCDETWHTYEEKMTDVNIAVELLADAYEDVFDTAIVISADSDLSRPITIVQERFPDKRVVVVFPPDRRSYQLQSVATASLFIGSEKLRNSQLPENVIRRDGHALARPSSWK